MAKQTVMTLPKKGTTDAKAEAKKLLSEMQASATTINPAEAEPANPRLVRVQSLIAEGKTEAEAMTQVDKEEAEAAKAAQEEKEAQLRIDAQIAIQKAFESAKLKAKAAGFEDVSGVMLSEYVDTQHFINLRGFGSNRDVAKRLKAKKNTHLKGALTSLQQLVVSVAQTIPESGAGFYDADEPFMKIDGHSRAAAWTEGQLAIPEKVLVQFLPNMDKEKILIEYNVFIHSLATGTATEQNDIDNKMLGFAPESGFVQASWRSAFADISRKPYKEMLERFSPVLMQIDTWSLALETGKASVKRQSSGIRAAMLQTFSTDDKAIWEAFWKDFLAQEKDNKGKAKPVDSKIKQADLLRAFVLNHTGAGSVGIEEVSTQAKEYFYEYSDLAKARAAKQK